MKQYAQGERFIAAVEAPDGFLERAWQDPAKLPTLDEIRDPQIDRVHQPTPA